MEAQDCLQSRRVAFEKQRAVSENVCLVCLRGLVNRRLKDVTYIYIYIIIYDICMYTYIDKDILCWKHDDVISAQS